jgi:hypothetical protein
MNISSNTTALYNNRPNIRETSSIKNNKSIQNFENILNTKTKTLNGENNKYLAQIKENFPQSTINVKSMTAGDVQSYYQEWKNQPIKYSRDITISPKVLEKMENDPAYAEQMMLKINKAATPEGFGGAALYEYKVIVRDDGKIETMACADFMIGKKDKVQNEEEDEEEEKIKKIKELKRKMEMSSFDRKLHNQQELAKTGYFNMLITL